MNTVRIAAKQMGMVRALIWEAAAEETARHFEVSESRTEARQLQVDGRLLYGEREPGIDQLEAQLAALRRRRD